MADDPNDPPAPPATGEPPKADPPPDPKPAPKSDGPGYPEGLGDAGKRALDAERQARKDLEAKVKDLEPLAAKAKELEDASKTEQQKLAEQLEAAKAEGTQSSASLLRLEVALEKAPEGTPVKRVRTLAKRLSGSTREELEADADELFAEFSSGPVVPTSRNQGRGGGATTEDVSKVVDAIPRGL